jgi:hypothetical protein
MLPVPQNMLQINLFLEVILRRLQSLTYIAKVCPASMPSCFCSHALQSGIAPVQLWNSLFGARLKPLWKVGFIARQKTVRVWPA